MTRAAQHVGYEQGSKVSTTLYGVGGVEGPVSCEHSVGKQIDNSKALMQAIYNPRETKVQLHYLH
jgi:hypothetical protein